VVGMELGEALGAIATLQQERPALGDGAKRALQTPRLAREDQRRIGAQELLNGIQRRLIRILRNLPDRHAPPAIETPFPLRHDRLSPAGPRPRKPKPIPRLAGRCQGRAPPRLSSRSTLLARPGRRRPAVP